MFTRPLPLAGESSFEGISKLFVNGMLTAGVAVTQNVIEVYLTRHLNVPAIVGYPALKDVAGSIHRHRPFASAVTLKRHYHGLGEKQFLKIALPASTTVKHASSASYVFQPPSTKATIVSIVLCVAVAIITASAVFLTSSRRGVSESSSSTSSTSTAPSSSDGLSTQGSSSLQARRGILVTRPGGSGGNDPARGRDSGGSSSSRRHQPSPLRQTLATAESGSPPPPPPPHFPPPAEDDDGHDEAASGFSVDWISIALVIPIFVQLKKIFFGRARRSDGRSATLADGGGISDENVADTSSEDPTCDNILPLSEAKVLPKPIPTTHDADRACRNFLPLTTHRSSTIIGSRDHPTHLPGLAPRGSSIHDSKAIEVAGTGLSLGFLSTVVFMVGAFISPLVPLVFYRIAVRQPESSEPAGQGTDSADSADGESSEEGEVYDMVLERPEVRPVEDQVLARIAMHFRPLRDDFMDSESEVEDALDVPGQHKIQTPTPPRDNPVRLPNYTTPPNVLNPQANTFVPKKSRATHDERLARWKASRFPQPPPRPHLVPIPARTGESSSRIPQSSNGANRSQGASLSSMNPPPPPPPARTPGSSVQSSGSGSASRELEGSRSGSALTPNQKASLRRKMRRRARREEDGEGEGERGSHHQGDVVGLGSSNSMA